MDTDPGLGLKAEWDRARGVIEGGDDKVADLRKTGFTFITGLITAGAFLGGQSFVSAGAGYLAVVVALAAISALVALRFAEREVALRQSAAAARAHLIERHHAVELTGFLTDRSHQERWRKYSSRVYICLVLVAAIVSGATILCSPRPAKAPPARYSLSAPQWVQLSFVVGAAGLGWLMLRRIGTLRAVKGTGGDPLRTHNTDWHLDVWKVTAGQPVLLWVTNLETGCDLIPLVSGFGPGAIAALTPIVDGTAPEPLVVDCPLAWQTVKVGTITFWTATEWWKHAEARMKGRKWTRELQELGKLPKEDRDAERWVLPGRSTKRFVIDTAELPAGKYEIHVVDGVLARILEIEPQNDPAASYES